jgi:hypothetical protein
LHRLNDHNRKFRQQVFELLIGVHGLSVRHERATSTTIKAIASLRETPEQIGLARVDAIMIRRNCKTVSRPATSSKSATTPVEWGADMLV